MGRVNCHSLSSHPLNIVLAPFKEVKTRARNRSVDVSKKKMHMYSSSEWPTFGVGWPPKGNFHLPTVLAVEDKVFQKVQGYPEQVPCIVVWKDLVANLLPWVKSFLLPFSSATLPPGTIPALMAEEQKQEVSKSSKYLYPILQDSTPEEVIFPPPYTQAPVLPEVVAPAWLGPHLQLVLLYWGSVQVHPPVPLPSPHWLYSHPCSNSVHLGDGGRSGPGD